MQRSLIVRLILLLACCVALPVPAADAGGDPAGMPAAPPAAGVQPFGAALFTGNFLKTREDGLNPAYVIAPGDRVNVRTWGAIEINDVYTVDSQGNIFLPDIGPLRLEGVRNGELTPTVKAHVRKVYTSNVEVYTNLVSAQPVAVFVTGLVNKPGRYDGVPSDSILFFLDLAGGIDPALGSYRNIDILRKDKTIATIDLYEFLLQGRIAIPQLQDNDTVLVRHRGPVVELAGNVARPALVELKDGAATGAGVLEIIPQAAQATEVTLVGMRDGQPFNQTLSLADFRTSPLHDGDTVTLRDDGRADTILVNIEGEHEGPSVLSIRRGARLVDVLDHIAVNRALANTDAIYLRRVSVARSQKDAINDSLFRLERSSLLALSGSSNEAAIRTQEAKLVETFAERARLIDPLGRVVTTQDGVQQNILLEPDDTIVIPTRTQIVKVAGEVLMMHAATWREGWTAEDYIRLAGNYTERADTAKVIVHHPNAAVDIVSPGDARIGPGDEILVLPKVDKKYRQFGIDLLDIVYKIAISAKVALNL
ncbi:MAG: polysaccharide biosynthesis/export family protein [Pseudomonadota bacterium]